MACARWKRLIGALPKEVVSEPALTLPRLHIEAQSCPAAHYARPVEVRSLGYRTDLMVRLLEGSQLDDRGDYLAIRSPQNPAYWWGNFLLLSAPPHRGETRKWLDLFAAEFPSAGHVALGIDVTEAGAVKPAELVAAGLRMRRSTVMVAADVHEPPNPNQAATYRVFAGDDDWRQAAQLRAEL